MVNQLSSLSFAGLIGGSIVGIGVNVWNNASLFSKSITGTTDSATTKDEAAADNGRSFHPPAQYDCSILGTKVFEKLNKLKQAEIKTFAFATPYAPLVTNIATTVFSTMYTRGTTAGLSELVTRVGMLPVKKLLAPMIASTIGVMARPYIGRAFRSDDPNSLLYRFNPSGHMIAKLSSALALYTALEATMGQEDDDESMLKMTLIALQVVSVVATDALMMFYTGAIHHSAAELATGGLIFAGSYQLANLVSEGFCRSAVSVAGQVSQLVGSFLSHPF
jgi:hypothetical protein